MTAPTSPASGALPADTEQRRAIKEGERIASADTHFRLRHPMLDTRDRRNVFEAAFDRGYDAALASREATEDGYAKAFYEIASVLGIGARADTPENVFRNEMLPKIKLMAEVFGDKYCAECRKTKGADPAALASPQVAPALTDEQLDEIRFNNIDRISCDCNEMQAMRDAIAADRALRAAPAPVAPTPAQSSQWQPIETAPKDGTRFLAWQGGRSDFFHWQGRDDGSPVGWRDSFITVYPEGSESAPKFWMPLPSEPEEEPTPSQEGQP